MKKQDQAIAGIIVTGGVILLLAAIANNPRISPFWRKLAQTAEGDIFQHVFTGELVTLLAA